MFVRTSGCNLRCDWCDTPYASWEPEGERMTVAQIMAQVASHAPARHVVLTGGEPMISKGLGALSEALKAGGYHITVETAGTVARPDVRVDLMSISPKLSNSSPTRGSEKWRERHETRRINLEVLRGLMSGEHQLKFVVAAPGDLDEIEALLSELSPAPERVLLMPEGRTTASLDASMGWLVEACKARGYRLCDRLHVRLFGDARGT